MADVCAQPCPCVSTAFTCARLFVHVGAGIRQQSPSRHLPVLSSASGPSPITVRPSQQWTALPHRLAPSSVHTRRDGERGDSRPSQPILLVLPLPSRQCCQWRSGPPRAPGAVGLCPFLLARGTARPAGAGAGPQGIHGPGLLAAGTDGHGGGVTCSLVMPGSVGECSRLPHAGSCAGGIG